MRRRTFLKAVAALPVVGRLSLTADAPLPSSCYFDATHPLWTTVKADLTAAGFTNMSTIGTGAYVGKLTIAVPIYPYWKNISPAALPREDYDRYSLDTAVVVTLSSS